MCFVLLVYLCVCKGTTNFWHMQILRQKNEKNGQKTVFFLHFALFCALYDNAESASVTLLFQVCQLSTKLGKCLWFAESVYFLRKNSINLSTFCGKDSDAKQRSKESVTSCEVARSSSKSVTSVTNITHLRVRSHQLFFFQPLLPSFIHFTPYFSVFYMPFFHKFKR